MSNKILPITALRDTAKIDEEIHKSSDPIFVTKNGFGDFVLVSQEYFDSHFLHPHSKAPTPKTQPFVLNTALKTTLLVCALQLREHRNIAFAGSLITLMRSKKQ
jgi:hypothetical protein